MLCIYCVVLERFIRVSEPNYTPLITSTYDDMGAEFMRWSSLFTSFTYLLKHVFVNHTVVVKEYSMKSVSGRQNCTTPVFFFMGDFSFLWSRWHRPKLSGWQQFFRKWLRVWKVQGSWFWISKRRDGRQDRHRCVSGENKHVLDSFY